RARLYPHRPDQGPAGIPGDLGARLAQRAGTDPGPVRPVVTVAGHRLTVRRIDFHLAGLGRPDLGRHRDPRLSADHGRGPAGFPGRGRRQPAGGCAALAGRPSAAPDMNLLRGAAHTIWKDRGGRAGLLLLALLVILAIVAPFFLPDPRAMPDTGKVSLLPP